MCWVHIRNIINFFFQFFRNKWIRFRLFFNKLNCNK